MVPASRSAAWRVVSCSPAVAHARHSEITQEQPDSRTVLGVTNEYLAAGRTFASRIRRRHSLTKIGLERPTSPRTRSALSNLCAAHAARTSGRCNCYCNQSLEINDANWQRVQQSRVAYTERMFGPSRCRSRRRAVVNPNARQMPQIAHDNERRLRVVSRLRSTISCAQGVAAVSPIACLACAANPLARRALSPVGTWSCVRLAIRFGDEPRAVQLRAGRHRAAAHIEASRSGVERFDAVGQGRSRGAVQRSADGTAVHSGLAARQSRRHVADADATGGWWCSQSDIEVIPETTEARAGRVAADPGRS